MLGFVHTKPFHSRGQQLCKLFQQKKFKINKYKCNKENKL